MSTTAPAAQAIQSDPAYINEDMAPVPPKGRKWGTRDIAALWVSMSALHPHLYAGPPR